MSGCSVQMENENNDHLINYEINECHAVGSLIGMSWL